MEAALFDTVQEHLTENKQRARIPEKGSRYLLQGLLVCAQCGYAYCGCTMNARNAYYRCGGALSLPRRGFERLCWNKPLWMDQTDTAVWQEVCCLLEDPARLEQEYRQRLLPDKQPTLLDSLQAQLGKLRRGTARLIDSYTDGLIDKAEFEPRLTQLRERLHHLEDQIQRLRTQAEEENTLRLILSRLETFAAKVHDGLHQADFQTRRDIIRTLVKRVEVHTPHIRVVFRVSPISLPEQSSTASPDSQHWGRRVHPG